MSQLDRECVERCLDGHPDDFRNLVERYQPVLLAYLAGCFGQSERAEEAAQESFVRAYFNLERLKKPGSFYSWLLGIANRVVKEQFRTERKHRQIARLIKQSGPPVEFSEEFTLEKAIADLPDSYRQIVLLRYYGGLSCKDVAQQMEMPLGTVTKMLSRAYGMLRESMEQNDKMNR